MIKTTKQIEKDYGITRQTIYNWIKEGLLIPPKKDFRNWLVWDEEDESRLKKIINDKEKINNTEKSKSNEGIQGERSSSPLNLYCRIRFPLYSQDLL